MKISFTKLTNEVISPNIDRREPVKIEELTDKLVDWLRYMVQKEYDKAAYGQVVEVSLYVNQEEPINIEPEPEGVL
jgi:hypothetical protein